MINLQKIIFICFIFFIFITSVFAITNKDKILLLLEHYQEECYEYKWNYENISMQTCFMSFNNLCFDCKPECYWYKNVTTQIFLPTEKCIKYHLVRYK